MAEQFYTILTQVGKAKIANASALGIKVDFKYFALGDGGGSYYNPIESQTGLKNEVWRGKIGNVAIDESNPNWIVLENIIPSSIGGFMIREAGVFDDEENLIAIGKYPETYKPVVENGSAKDLIIKMILEVSNTSAVTLKIDPTIILATKKDIDTLSNRIKKNETDIKELKKGSTIMEDLQTENKTLAGAINEALDKANEAFQSASDGKTVIASSITAKGVLASKEDTFPTLAGKINQIETDKTGDATATAADILAPETAYVRGKKVTGVIKDYNKSHKVTERMAVASPNVHAYSYKVYSDLPGGDVTNPPKFHILLAVPKGYYGPETYLGADVPGLEPSNIKKGVQISKNPPSNAGLVGAFTGEGTAPSSHVLIGSTFSNNTQMGVSGTMPDNGEFAKHITTQGGSYQIPQGYHNGAGYVKAQFNNLVSSNIRKDVNIGGVVGSLLPIPYFADNSHGMHWDTQFSDSNGFPANSTSTFFMSPRYDLGGGLPITIFMLEGRGGGIGSINSVVIALGSTIVFNWSHPEITVLGLSAAQSRANVDCVITYKNSGGRIPNCYAYAITGKAGN